MPRHKSFDENEVLEQAMLLFWEKGYEATSMKDLESAMQLKVTSIYNAFGNKRALFEKSLNYYLENVLVTFLQAIKMAGSTNAAMLSVLNEVIKLHFNENNPGGCMVVLSILESHQHDQVSRDVLEGTVSLLRNVIVERLEQDEQASKAGIDPIKVANQMTATITGMTVLAKAGFEKAELEELARNTVDTLRLAA